MLLDNRPKALIGDILPVEITEEDLKNSSRNPRRSMNCAMAMALNRTYGGSWQVGGSIAFVDRPGRPAEIYHLDGAAEKLVYCFDANQPKVGTGTLYRRR